MAAISGQDRCAAALLIKTTMLGLQPVLPPEPLTTFARRSGRSLEHSHQTNAQTISETQATA